MIIYILFKLILSYFVVIKKKWIKDQDNLFLFIDSVVLLLYVLHVYHNGFVVFISLIKLSLVFICIFICYKLVNYLLNNSEKVFIKLRSILGNKIMEKAKGFFLKPIICKTIYYLIGFLPWNILYYLYFGSNENGWYLNVGFYSARDVFFWKYFKGDSRDFFYEAHWHIYLKFTKPIYNFLLMFFEAIYRLIYLLYALRKGLLSINVTKYLWLRIVVYMYLSLFYFYLLMEIQYLNIILFYVLILTEFCFIFFTKQILQLWAGPLISVLEKNDRLTGDFLWFLYFMKEPLSVDYMKKGEVNKFIGDKTLSNSVTLNMLYKYILFVNKNTKGYFAKQMNIMTRIHRKKILEEKSVIGDILPRTRYVIMSLKGQSHVHDKVEDLDPPEFHTGRGRYINLRNNKHFYLSFYEKTYSKTSLLLVIGMLRVDKRYGSNFLRVILFQNDHICFYGLEKFCEHHIMQSFYLHFTLATYINKLDKRLISDEILFTHFLDNNAVYYAEEAYFRYNIDTLNFKRTDQPIPNEFHGLNDYKKIFKIMGRIMLNEEEAVTWNVQLQELLSHYYSMYEKNEILNAKIAHHYYSRIMDVNSNSLRDLYSWTSYRDYFYKENLKVSFMEIYEQEQFFRFILLLKVTGNMDKFAVTKHVLFEQISDEDLIDIVYYYHLYSHKEMSEKQYYMYKGSEQEYYHFEFDIDYSQIEEYNI